MPACVQHLVAALPYQEHGKDANDSTKHVVLELHVLIHITHIQKGLHR